MEARFWLTPADVYHYHRFGYRHLRQFQRWLLFQLALIPLGVALACVPLFFFRDHLSPDVVIFFTGVWVLGGTLNLALYKVFLYLHVATVRGVLGEHHLVLSPAGIRYRSWRGDLFIPWQQVQAIQQDPYNLYFLLNSAGPLDENPSARRRLRLFLNQVCIVPKKFFGHPLNASAFVDAATTLRGNALSAQQATSFCSKGGELGAGA